MLWLALSHCSHSDFESDFDACLVAVKLGLGDYSAGLEEWDPWAGLLPAAKHPPLPPGTIFSITTLTGVIANKCKM